MRRFLKMSDEDGQGPSNSSCSGKGKGKTKQEITAWEKVSRQNDIMYNSLVNLLIRLTAIEPKVDKLQEKIYNVEDFLKIKERERQEEKKDGERNKMSAGKEIKFLANAIVELKFECSDDRRLLASMNQVLWDLKKNGEVAVLHESSEKDTDTAAKVQGEEELSAKETVESLRLITDVSEECPLDESEFLTDSEMWETISCHCCDGGGSGIPNLHRIIVNALQDSYEDRLRRLFITLVARLIYTFVYNENMYYTLRSD